MAIAGGITNIFASLASRNWYFRSVGPSGLIDGNKAIAGTWDSIESAAKISWNGPDPSFTASASVTAESLAVAENPDWTIANVGICSIGHAPVPLESGDTIIYQSIEIAFTT